MEKILEAINSKNEKKIAELIQTSTLGFEKLDELLKASPSENIREFIKKEFSNKFEKKFEVNDTNTSDDKVVSDELQNSSDDLYESLTCDQAMKKYKFDNSKHDKALEMFFNSFKSNIENINFDKAANISKKIVDQLISEFSATFPKEVRSKSHNLKENTKLCANVYYKSLDTSDFVKMTTEQMQSEDLRSKDSEYIKNSLLASQLAKVAADTDMFKCGRCKQRKCTYSQLQTRSCDEPMTTFVSCTVCGNRWKF